MQFQIRPPVERYTLNKTNKALQPKLVQINTSYNVREISEQKSLPDSPSLL